MKKILITGGCGFVGRHFAKKLSEDKNNKITIVDNLSTGVHYDKWPEHLKCDNLEIIYDDCINYFHTVKTQFDLIIHLAAIVEGRLTQDNDPLKIAKDLAIDSQMFKWCVETKPHKIIYFSSTAVYPLKLQTQEYNILLKEEFVDIKNDVIAIPDLAYGWAKLTGEFLSHLAVTKYGLNVVIYRPSSGYGEDQALSYPFPSIMKRIVNNDELIDVWNSGDQSRDFIHIDDVIDGVLLTYEDINNASAINLGANNRMSFKELIKLAYKLEYGDEKECKINPLLDKPMGVFARHSDNTILFDKYHFVPKYSLEDGIKKVIKYIKENKDNLIE